MSSFSHPGCTHFGIFLGDRGAPAAAVAGPYGSCLVNMVQENPLQFHDFFQLLTLVIVDFHV